MSLHLLTAVADLAFFRLLSPSPSLSSRALNRRPNYTMGPKKCEVCEDAQPKYKCPTCLITYCSLACFKKHKEIPCQKAESLKEEKIYPSSTTNDDKPSYVDEQSEVLQESQLQSVASSNEIRDLVKSEKLQKLILNIDCSADPENELAKAMEEESFRLFTQKILSTIGPDAGDA
ncbi:hypothetical protein C2S53_017125 [Perilla frutescens var. hirtella]|uniref:HIT-type domain-containing protein n=1 Tax=Perilla frutescens var. hirtella TaxID=608512 RepID=A0AAD4P4I8_PERFH|nr:hypothetical protein C2S53_017125 [Perilla frutescens var. hirtella]